MVMIRRGAAGRSPHLVRLVCGFCCFAFATCHKSVRGACDGDVGNGWRCSRGLALERGIEMPCGAFPGLVPMSIVSSS